LYFTLEYEQLRGSRGWIFSSGTTLHYNFTSQYEKPEEAEVGISSVDIKN
jgi:hypothetical protein